MNMGLGSFLAAVAMGGAVLFLSRGLQGTHCCNGVSAIASLRNLGSVQQKLQADGEIDVDGDGQGEFGTFGEMTGVAGLRTDARATARSGVLSPAVLSPSLAGVDARGMVTKAGFGIRIFLPAEKYGASREGQPGQPFTAPVDSAAASRSWCAYAWPMYPPAGPVRGCRQHDRTFYVDATGSLWYAENAYWGGTGGPDWDAAMPRDGKGPHFSLAPAGVNEIVGRDGRTWKRLP